MSTEDRFWYAVGVARDRMLAKNFNPTPGSDDDEIALALLNNAGQGPWEDQRKRIQEWADGREATFGKVRDVLESFGITTHHGKLEDQVKALGDNVNRHCTKTMHCILDMNASCLCGALRRS